jgi:tRNA threonylcarbamoyladenosine biosynthesis protein TsaE
MKYKIEKIQDLENVVSFLIPFIKPNFYVVLEGDLGAGKTTFVKKIAAALNINGNLSSPTFDIMRRYFIQERGIFLNHFDFFRLKNKDDLISFKEFAEDNFNIIE